MKALIDGDILRYELGFAAETGWKAITESEDLPPFRYVQELLDARIDWLLEQTGSDSCQIYLTSGRTFRYDIAKTKPYKGTRVENKPYHFDNLTAYLRHVKNAKVVTGIEADDQLALDHLSAPADTIIVSRDKDLKQVTGHFYSWELGNQPSFGPTEIAPLGELELQEKRDERGRVKSLKLVGTGYLFFAAQVLMGDPVDNIPGLPGCGPRAAYELLKDCSTPGEAFDAVARAYREKLGNGFEELLLEQGQLCWITRRLHEDGKPVLWELGMTA